MSQKRQRCSAGADGSFFRFLELDFYSPVWLETWTLQTARRVGFLSPWSPAETANQLTCLVPNVPIVVGEREWRLYDGIRLPFHTKRLQATCMWQQSALHLPHWRHVWCSISTWFWCTYFFWQQSLYVREDDSFWTTISLLYEFTWNAKVAFSYGQSLNHLSGFSNFMALSRADILESLKKSPASWMHWSISSSGTASSSSHCEMSNEFNLFSNLSTAFSISL